MQLLDRWLQTPVSSPIFPSSWSAAGSKTGAVLNGVSSRHGDWRERDSKDAEKGGELFLADALGDVDLYVS